MAVKITDSKDDSESTVGTPRLPSIDNFRDIAGPHAGYEVPHGRIRKGVLYRSNRLEANETDLSVLNALGLTAIHDLREAHEIEAHPDSPVDGARWHHHPVTGIPRDTAEHLADADETYAAMIDNYRRYVTEPRCREGFGSLLRTIADTEGSQLFHCAAGKDRTGWAALLIHHIVGVQHDDIVTDYLSTDDYAKSSQKATLDSIIENLGPDRAPAYRPAFVCDTNYLNAAFTQVDSRFGSLDRYLRDGLDLSPSQQAAIRDRLVESSVG